MESRSDNGPPRGSPFARPLTSLQRAAHTLHWKQVEERARKRYRALELWHEEIRRGVRSVHTSDALADAARLERMARDLERRAWKDADEAWRREDPQERWRYRVACAAGMRGARLLKQCAQEIMVAAERWELDAELRRRVS